MKLLNCDFHTFIAKFRDDVRGFLVGTRSLFGMSPDNRMGIRSGFSEFDQHTRGYHKGKLYVAGGRPGSGKTSWVTTQIANIIMSQPEVQILLFSTELNEQEIVMQVVEAYTGGIPVYPNGRTSTDEEVAKLEAGLVVVGEQLNKGLFHVVFKKRLSVEILNQEIGMFCMGVAEGHDAIVIIDQASRIEREDKNKHGYAIATEHLLNTLEVLAEQHHLPVLLMTQLNRTTEIQKRAGLSNLKHSGAFEEFAHAVFLLEKCDGHGKRRGGSAFIDNSATVNIAKNRHGRVGVIEFNFTGEAHYWTESTDREEGI